MTVKLSHALKIYSNDFKLNVFVLELLWVFLYSLYSELVLKTIIRSTL